MFLVMRNMNPDKSSQNADNEWFLLERSKK